MRAVLNEQASHLEDPCPICSELQGASDSRFASVLRGTGFRNLIGPYGDRLAVIPSLGALGLGHTLIVTKEHSSCVLALATDLSIRTELRSLIEILIETLFVGRVESALLFEHGRCKENPKQNLCSTTHGHIHFVPLEAHVSSTAFAMIRGDASDIEFDDMPPNAARTDEYFACTRIGKSGVLSTGIVRNAALLESQFARRIIAEALGLKRWRWQEFEHDIANVTYLEGSHRFRRNVCYSKNTGLQKTNGLETPQHLAL